MINPLKVATAGYLKRRCKSVLIIAVAGYLNYSCVPPVNGKTPKLILEQKTGTGDHDSEYDAYKKRVLQDDDEIISLLKVFVECL